MAKKTTATGKSAAAKKTTTRSRTATTSKKPAAKKATPTKQQFSDEQIAMKAYEIYQARLARGEQSHSDDDWHKAVQELKKEKK